MVPRKDSHEIRPRDLSTRASELRVVDVRECAEFDGQLGHVPGAELVPIPELSRTAASWNRAIPVVVVCHSGGLRSGRAATLLAGMGFKTMKLVGGMHAYAAAGLSRERDGRPIVCSPGPSGTKQHSH